jgi:hypothetical protein
VLLRLYVAHILKRGCEIISVMKNTFTLFKKNKEMIYLITIQPIMIFLLMLFLLPYTTMHNVVVSNDSTKVADELTASAEVRGVKLKGDYNPYYEVKMRVFDWIALIAVILCATGMKDVTSKLEELRGTLTEIEKRKTTGEYNLNASIEVEKKLKAVVDLDSFDSDTLKLILDRVLIKADGTEEYIWKDLEIV